MIPLSLDFSLQSPKFQYHFICQHCTKSYSHFLQFISCKQAIWAQQTITNNGGKFHTCVKTTACTMHVQKRTGTCQTSRNAGISFARSIKCHLQNVIVMFQERKEARVLFQLQYLFAFVIFSRIFCGVEMGNFLKLINMKKK